MINRELTPSPNACHPEAAEFHALRRGTPNEGPMHSAGGSGAADESIGPSARKERGPQDDKAVYTVGMSGEKTFYLETFGCQMNVHDSEKVIGTLVHEGYRQVEAVEQADLILYNTCSIRDKAEQKVFHRLADYKKLLSQGKKFGVLGCVAQQEGEKIFERAPHVSLVCGSASYRNLPQMLVNLENTQVQSQPQTGNSRSRKPEAGSQSSAAENLVRITGLDDRETDKCFETEFTARTNPHRGYITIIEGCDKFCAYCVVPFTRGKERSRTSESVLSEARQMADLGYTEIQVLGQNVNSYKDPAGGFSGKKKSFAELLAAVGEVAGIRRVRFMTSHPRDFGRDIVEAIDAVPTLCDHVHLPVQSGSDRVLNAMQRLYTREQYLERIAWMKAAKRADQHHQRSDRRISRRDRRRFRRNSFSDRGSRLRRGLHLQIFAQAEHAVAGSRRRNPRRREISPTRGADVETERNPNAALQEVHRNNLGSNG